MSRFLPKRLDGIFPKQKSSPEQETILPLNLIEEAKEPSFLEKYAEEPAVNAQPEETALEETPLQDQGVIITDPAASVSPDYAEETDKSCSLPKKLWRILKKISQFKKSRSAIASATSPLAKEIQEHRKLRLIGWGIAAGCAFAIIITLVLSTAFASLTVTVKPRTDNHPIPDTTITLDSSTSRVSSGQRVIPAERLEFTQHAEKKFQSSGKEHVEDRAKGRVKIYNKYSSSPQSLVAATRFITDSGMIYRLPKGITIPGAKVEEGKIVPQFIESELVADKPGEQANRPEEITLKIPGFKDTPKFDGFYAIAPSGFSQGFVGEAEVVTRDDIKNAQEKVTKEVYDALKNGVLGKIPPNFKFIDALREIEITKINSPQEKTRAVEFNVAADAASRIIVFRESDLLQMLHEYILNNDATKEVLADGSRIEYQVRSVDFENGKATLTLKGTFKTKTVISAGDLKALLKGKKEGSIIELLKEKPELASFRLTFFPFWLSRAPASEDKIKLQTVEP